MDPRVSKVQWGEYEGQAVFLYTLRNSRGLSVQISSWGATVVAINVPDRHGNIADVALGWDTHADWVKHNPSNYMGAAVGRTSNRISNDRFDLDGVTYHLASSKPGQKNHLHGGPKGFSFRVWEPCVRGASEFFLGDKAVGMRLQIHSPDGDQGYCGNVDAIVSYWVNEDNEWSVHFEARTDRACPVMLTSHSYFNLSGGLRDIRDQEVQIFADEMPEVDQDLIPTGKIRKVEGTPMDFRTPHKVGEFISQPYDMLKAGNDGYDLAFIINSGDRGRLTKAAVLSDPVSGRIMEVLTDQRIVQFYTGQHLDATGKKGQHYSRNHGLCFETHGFVDAPNHTNFPSITLRPGELYSSLTVHRFSTK